MTIEEYKNLALRTENQDFHRIVARIIDSGGFGYSTANPTLRFLHACMGLATESGELLDIAKAAIFYGKKPRDGHIEEELGDLLWYAMLAADALDINIQGILSSNIAKLQARCPEKYTDHHAVNRDLNTENEILVRGASSGYQPSDFEEL